MMNSKCLYVAVATLLISCHQNPENGESINMQSDRIEKIELSPSPPAQNAPANEMVKFSPPVTKDDAVESAEKQSGEKQTRLKKIIKDGSISIKVADLERAKKQLDSAIKNLGGYYEKEEYENYEGRVEYQLTVRIPCKQFEAFLSTTEKANGEVIFKTVNTRDVTGEYMDGEIRLNSKKLFRKRYFELLTKAGKVDDILAIEENIRNLQEEIESQEGNLKLLDDQVMYSMLDVRIFREKEIKVVEARKELFTIKVMAGLGKGWDAVIDSVLFTIRQWPWVVALFFITIALRRLWRKRKK